MTDVTRRLSSRRQVTHQELRRTALQESRSRLTVAPAPGSCHCPSCPPSPPAPSLGVGAVGDSRAKARSSSISGSQGQTAQPEAGPRPWRKPVLLTQTKYEETEGGYNKGKSFSNRLPERQTLDFLPGKSMGCSPLWLEYGCSKAALCCFLCVLRAQSVDQFKAISLPPSVKTTSRNCAPGRVTGPHWGRPVGMSLLAKGDIRATS